MGLRVSMAVVVLVWASAAESAVSIRNDAPLTFGTVIATATAGSVTVTSTGTRNVVAVFPIGSAGFSPAAFTVTITGGSPQFSVVVPSSTTLSDGKGHAMTVDGFESTPVTGKVSRAASDTASITVGATLHIDANQAAGPYNGTFLITVNNY